jgi:carbonyl reductase 1
LYATSRKGIDLGLKSSSSTIEIKYPQLDIADAASIQSLADTVESDHLGVDVLINNAGVNLDDAYSPINVKKTLDTNYRGTLKV